jgi:hypothetical protein
MRERAGILGRDADLALLRMAVDEAADGSGQLALITGEAVVGKTTANWRGRSTSAPRAIRSSSRRSPISW